MSILELLHSNKDGVNRAAKLIYNYQQGNITPIKTSIDHLNNMLHGGLFPGTIVSICARSGHGKTYTAHTLREDIISSPVNAGVLIYNWEMTFFNLMLVEMRKRSQLKYKELLTLKNPTEEQKKMMRSVIDSFNHDKLTTISQSLSPQEFDKVTREYIKQEKERGRMQVVVMVDHIGITKGANKMEALSEIMEAMNQIKLDFPDFVTFIVLGQLNRKVDALFRSTETNPLNLRLSPEFIYNSDGLMQYSDLILGQVFPDKFNMQHFTAVNKEKFEHLEEHFSDMTHKGEFAVLKASNRIYYDYIKPRLEDGQPTLYAGIIDPEREHLMEVKEPHYSDVSPNDGEIEF